MTQARYDASRHFNARSDGHGGVRLSLRTRFRDQGESFLPGSKSTLGTGVTEPPIERVGAKPVSDDDEDNGSKVEQTICVFGPVTEGQSYRFEELDNGCIRVVLVSDPADLMGNTDTVSPNSGTIPTNLNSGPSATTDRLASFVSHGGGSEASKLRTLNAINKRYFGR